ncbi:hypothetical protein OV450_0892 [Actinobacteria bacterium OV450]|nr:hypothetical protein OV450_0892 [Actinobacteria bacterium OV450]
MDDSERAIENTPVQPNRGVREGHTGGPASAGAAADALLAIQALMNAAYAAPSGDRDGAPEQALAALQLLREIREALAAWESGLIETARGSGASWAELAGPLGVASRQAAERRYLRLRPGAAETTGEQRVQAVRDRRAADRTVAAWAEQNVGALRQLAGQIIGLSDLPATSEGRIEDLTAALGQQGAARLVEALAATHADLEGHAELAERVDGLRREARRLRDDSDEKRRP